MDETCQVVGVKKPVKLVMAARLRASRAQGASWVGRRAPKRPENGTARARYV